MFDPGFLLPRNVRGASFKGYIEEATVGSRPRLADPAIAGSLLMLKALQHIPAGNTRG